MARSKPGDGQWPAFLAGAVVMLLIALAWLAWSRTDQAMRIIGRLMVPRPPAADFPRTPPPEGPHVPKIPVPKPR